MFGKLRSCDLASISLAFYTHTSPVHIHGSKEARITLDLCMSLDPRIKKDQTQD